MRRLRSVKTLRTLLEEAGYPALGDAGLFGAFGSGGVE